SRRWYLFGRVRAHDRRGERNWVADLLQDQAQIMDLLADPRIAGQFLPIAMRVLFWVGNLDLAVQVIGFLASSGGDDDTAILVDAALSDLLTRLENRVDEPEHETTLSILTKCVQLGCFERLPEDVRARYWRAHGRRTLEISDFENATASFTRAWELSTDAQSMRSSVAGWMALAVMRVHDFSELGLDPKRPERDEALVWLERATENEDAMVPESAYARGMLAYEQNDYERAIRCFDAANERLRRVDGRDAVMIDRTSFFLAAALLASEAPEEVSRALRLMDQALETVQPDLETFYSVHEALKAKDRKLALRFLDAIDIGRGTAPDQLLFVAFEYLNLGEAEPALQTSDRVLHVAVDLDQRIEAMRIALTARNMQGQRDEARQVFEDIRDLLVQRGAFEDLEKLLKNEGFVGQALDFLEIQCELVALYELMEDRTYEKAALQQSIARTLRSRKEVSSLREAHALLREAEVDFPDLVRDDLAALEKLLRLNDATPTQLDAGAKLVHEVADVLGHKPRILVVGGNERQRRHHPRFEQLAADWGFDGEWLMANYSSPQKLVSAIADRLKSGLEMLVLLHWNRHETTEPALELARKAGVPARTVHYAGFTSLEVCLSEQFERLATAKC
ncbi:MAG: hypothetical protein KDB80_00195, partial [Planctomycetes bacterium]|nr:hypothetical protein [Planctomycetota bacterium]